MKRRAQRVRRANSLETDGPGEKSQRSEWHPWWIAGSRERFLFLCRAHIISHQPRTQFLQQETQSAMLEKQRLFPAGWEFWRTVCTVLNWPDEHFTSLHRPTCQTLINNACCVPLVTSSNTVLLLLTKGFYYVSSKNLVFLRILECVAT